MKNRQFYLIFLIIISFAIGIACDCPKKLGFKDSDYVFYGKVIKKEYLNNKEFFPLVKVTFQVDSIFKGNVKNEFVLITVKEEGNSCGENFIISESYYIFTNKHETLYSVLSTICYPAFSQTQLDTNYFSKRNLREAFNN